MSTMHHRTIYYFFRRLFVTTVRSKLRTVQGFEHLPKDRPFILAANHCSWLDPVYLTAAVDRWSKHLPLLFISATKKHRWTQAVIPIDKQDKERCLHIAKEYLHRGLLVGIFPYGDQTLSAIKARTGVARLSRWSHAPVIPAAIENVTPAHAWKSVLTFLFQKRTIDISFGAPIELAPVPQITAETLAEDMERITGAMQQLNGKSYGV